MTEAEIEADQPHPISHGPDTGHESHAHTPHLAHHFDTMEQQYDSGKLGMWVFLATELLMFGGLFCAYAVYRANHPEVFIYAHTFLNTTWGAINTCVLLASSLTMAWAVRCSQLNQRNALVALLLATLCGGAGFMMIKAVEYNHKFQEYLGPGQFNQYNLLFNGPPTEGMNNAAGMKKLVDEEKAAVPTALPIGAGAQTPAKPSLYFDPNSGAKNPDHALITPRYVLSSGLSNAQATVTADTMPKPKVQGEEAEEQTRGVEWVDMSSELSRQRINTFFSIYYCMTGLHGVHVIVGMSLIYWILWRSANTRQRTWIPPLPLLAIGAYLGFIAYISGHALFLYIGLPFLVLGALWMVLRVLMAKRSGVVEEGEFSSQYFAPVDLIGLYWHLVDLIWIFLFPLLYLIHGHVGS